MHAALSGLASRQTTLRGKHLLGVVDIDRDLIAWVRRVWAFVDLNRLPEQVGHLTIRFFLRFLDRVDGKFYDYVCEAMACAWVAWKVYMDGQRSAIPAREFIKHVKLEARLHRLSAGMLRLGELRVARVLGYEFLHPLSTDFAVVLCECVAASPRINTVLALLRDVTCTIMFIKVSPLTLAAAAVVAVDPALLEPVCENTGLPGARVTAVAGEIVSHYR